MEAMIPNAEKLAPYERIGQAMDKAQLRHVRDELRRENQLFSSRMVPIAKDRWPTDPPAIGGQNRVAVWRNKEYLVQIFAFGAEGLLRLSVNRTSFDGRDWRDGITWDDLQRIKNEIGFADSTAVEVYPPQDRVVNIANIRHLVVLTESPSYVW
jgi:hypothetical protein